MTTPGVPAAHVRLTAPAMEDLQRLVKADPQIVRMALKKMILLERDPKAGKPLAKRLSGWRKLTFGDRAWRIVWRVSTDESGATVIDIAEVWAVGARADSEIYREMTERVASAETNPATTALSEVIEILGKAAGTTQASQEPAQADPIPDWLVARLVRQAGMSEKVIFALTPEKAMEAWEAFLTSER